MTRPVSKKLTTDFLWYLAGSFIPALVSIIRLPVFTRYFTPEEFGFYSLVSITFTYLSIALYNWISSCLWRYFTAYKNSRKLHVLYSNLAVLFLISTILVVTISVMWITFTRNQLVMKLIGSMMAYVIANQLVSFMLVIYRLRKQAFFYNLLFSLQALFAFGFTLLMIFGRDYRIEAIPLAQALIACMLLFFLLILNGSKIIRLSIKLISRTVLKELIQYGLVGLIASVGMLVLASSDRYIIALFSNMASVGIYNQVYQLGQVSVYFLVTVFFNTINPSLVRIFTEINSRKENVLLSYIRLFLMAVLPAATYLSLFARQVSAVMLGPEFQAGFPMIPFVMFSSFLYGLTLFSETKLKFIRSYKQVIVSITAACVINVGLNFILIPVWGYQSAALTTLTAYLFLFVLMYRSDPLRYLRDNAIRKKLYRIAIVLCVQTVTDLIIRKALLLDLSIGWTIVEGAAFAAVYVMFIFSNGKNMRSTWLMRKSSTGDTFI